MVWFAYLLRCADGSTYAGVTTDLARREHQHNHLASGARYTRSRRPCRMVWAQPCASRAQACALEWRLKRLPRGLKIELGRWHVEPGPTSREDAGLNPEETCSAP